MATYTSYLNLEKPTTSETFNLLKMNLNWDKIDQGVSALNSKIANLDLITGQTEGIKSIALDATKCPVGSIRWFDLRSTATADIPTNAQYGIARVNNRNATAITITIYVEFGDIYYCTYGGEWGEWKKVTMTTA